MEQTKPTHGGKRPGAGRKPTGQRPTTFAASLAVQAILEGMNGKSAFINRAIVELAERLGMTKSE